MKKELYYRIIISIIMSTLSIMGTNYFLPKSVYNTLNIILFMLFYYIYSNVLFKIKNRIIYIYSFLSSIICVIGHEVYTTHKLINIANNPLNYILILLEVYSLSMIFYKLLYYLIENKLKKIKKEKYTFSKHILIISIILLVISYLFAYISYFPGVSSYDLTTQNNMINGLIPITNFHPIIHTAIIAFFTFIECITKIDNLWIVLYSITQMSLVIFTYLYLLNWIYKNNMPKVYTIITYLYFLLNPIFIIFSFIATKDVYFSCFLLLFCISFIDYYKAHSKRNFFSLLISGVLACLFRNNMIYPLLVLLLIYFFIPRLKKLKWCFLLIAIIYFSIVKGLYSFLGYKDIAVQEMLSVPLLQMSDVYINSDTFNEEEKEELRHFAINIENFNPRFADGVKEEFNGTYLKNNPLTFFKIYFKGLINNPLDYISTFLDLNITYWYPNSQTIDEYSNRAYIEDDLYNNKPLLQDSYEIYHSFANYKTFIQKTPPFNIVFSLYFSFWFLFLISFTYLICNKNKYILSLLLLLFLFFCTYLLGPVSNLRYVYPYYSLMPLILGIILFDKKEIEF